MLNASRFRASAAGAFLSGMGAPAAFVFWIFPPNFSTSLNTLALPLGTTFLGLLRRGLNFECSPMKLGRYKFGFKFGFTVGVYPFLYPDVNPGTRKGPRNTCTLLDLNRSFEGGLGLSFGIPIR